MIGMRFFQWSKAWPNDRSLQHRTNGACRIRESDPNMLVQMIRKIRGIRGRNFYMIQIICSDSTWLHWCQKNNARDNKRESQLIQPFDSPVEEFVDALQDVENPFSSLAIWTHSCTLNGRHSGDLWLLCPLAGPSTVLHKTPDLVMNFRIPNPSMACIDLACILHTRTLPPKLRWWSQTTIPFCY